MTGPPINLDVALQYRGSAFPVYEAVARGRNDYLAEVLTGLRARCPYRVGQLRDGWMSGYNVERVDFAEAALAR